MQRMTDERLAEIERWYLSPRVDMPDVFICDLILEVKELKARLEAAGNLVGYWRQRYEGGKLADMPMEEYARFLECARDLKQALGGDDDG